MFTAIALGGGGVRGLMIVGALRELVRHQPLEFPDGIYGLSMGAILATALAYRIPIDKIQTLLQSVSINSIVPAIRLPHILGALSSKGMYSTQTIEDVVKQAFLTESIDLTDARLRDAPQPLKIVASNITRCTPTVFEGSVRTLDAIRASCAIPGVFHPYVIYDSVYVDGCLYTASMVDILPPTLQQTALIINLSKGTRGVTPQMVQEMPPWKFAEIVYQSTSQVRLRTTYTSNTVLLTNSSVRSLDTLSPSQQIDLINSGAEQLCAFWTKRVD
jgi:predicted acylesterase/phospholipase RssA